MRRSLLSKASRPRNAAASRPRRGLMSLLLCGLILAPAPAMTIEIPFFINNNTSVGQYVLCAGPWFRVSSDCVNRAPARTRVNFYSAELNFLSPLGEWRCWRKAVEACGVPIRRPDVEFCLDVEPDRVVPVELTWEGRLVVNFGPPPCTRTAVVAFLGDPSTGRSDRDVFRFDGEAGETIIMTLDRDGASGSTGEIAELILREERGDRLDTIEGSLPLELTITLPEAGTYAVEASGVGKSGGDPFRGHYRLTVTSDAGENRGDSLLLEPTSRTEP